MNNYFPNTFDPNAIFDPESVELYPIAEQLMNNINVLCNVLLVDNVDTPHKLWNPFSRYNSKMVSAFYSREHREINYDTIRKFEFDDEHGIVHGFFVAFWVAYLMNKRKKRKMVQLFGEVDDEFIDYFFSVTFHDFYRIYEDCDHDKQLKKIFPNCVDVTYRHSNPELMDRYDYLVIADRIELMRFQDMDIDYSVFDGILSPSEMSVIQFFYKNFRPKFQTMWDKRHEQVITHYVENPNEFDFKSPIYPNNNHKDLDDRICCVFTRPNFYNISEVNERFHMYGVIPISEIRSLPVAVPNEHPAMTMQGVNNCDEWIFVYTIENKFQQTAVKNGIYPIRYDTIHSFLYLTDQFMGNIYLNCFYEPLDN